MYPAMDNTSWPTSPWHAHAAGWYPDPKYAYHHFPQETQGYGNTSFSGGTPHHEAKDRDVYQPQSTAASQEEDKFHWKNALNNFIRGVGSPITGMFQDIKSFCLGIGTIGVGVALIKATRGAIAPVLFAAGLILGAYQTIKTAYKVLTARTNQQKEQVFYNIGATCSTLGLSLMGARSIMHSGQQSGAIAPGLDPKNLSLWQVIKENFNSIPSAVEYCFVRPKPWESMRQNLAGLFSGAASMLDEAMVFSRSGMEDALELCDMGHSTLSPIVDPMAEDIEKIRHAIQERRKKQAALQ